MSVPTATYRIQFHPGFGFSAAREIVSYLDGLGVSHLYASPIFSARHGSLHGYDVVDPNRINPELGGFSDLERLISELHAHELEWIQDIVPNHMAFHAENPFLMDVLEMGSDSRYYNFFDIEWDHSFQSIGGRLLAPFLGRSYGESLESGEIKLTYGQEGISVTYYDLAFPLRMDSYLNLFTHRLPALKKKLGEDHPDYIKLLGVLYILKTNPPDEESSEPYDHRKFVKRMLWEIYNRNEDFKEFVDTNIRIFNGTPGHAESFTLLDELLSQQLFRLSFWKVAAEEINYRRFFSINDLISLNVEHEAVFDRVHRLTFDLMDRGMISGLRVDHVDGLYDPALYLQKLREHAPESYLVVEKILGPDEDLPSAWPVQGTTGYDFCNKVNGIFCDTENEKAFSKIYSGVSGFKGSYEDLVRKNKKVIIEEDMAGDVYNLAQLVKGVAGRDRHGSDLTLYGLQRAFKEVLAAFPLYRTYINAQSFATEDREHIEHAIKVVTNRNPALLNELSFIRRFLLLEFPDYVSDDERDQWLRFAMRFQQFTGPLMAKGFEDTTLYEYNRLVSLNEVGGNPHRFGTTVEELHQFNVKRQWTWPHSLNATATHDTKRGEDVRARINVLSEIPQEWESAFRRWNGLNRRKKKRINGINVPDRNDEYFFYQNLLGAFPTDTADYPDFVARMKAYVVKAVREAKVHTAWLKPDTDYEEAFVSFVEAVLDPSERNAFLKELAPLQAKVAHHGAWSSLAQTLLKITSPGIPDFYQGTELWDLSLVDPDNRRPVDFAERIAFLKEIKARWTSDLVEYASELLAAKEDGRVKLFLIRRALSARNLQPDVFSRGEYIPLTTAGKFSRHVVAFARRYGNAWAVIAVPRFTTRLVYETEVPIGRQVWQDTEVILPEGAPGAWTDALTGGHAQGGGSLAMGEMLAHFPVALLVGSA